MIINPSYGNGNGDSYEKEEVLSNDTKALFGLSEEATPDDVFKAIASEENFSCGFIAQESEPSNTNLLWIDTTAETGGLKYYNGSAWVHVPVAYT